LKLGSGNDSQALIPYADSREQGVLMGVEEAMSQDRSSLEKRLEVLEIVLDESTDPIFNILADGTYRFVNKAFSGAFGKTPAEVIGKRIWDLFPEAEAAKRMTVVRRAFETGETIVFDVHTGEHDYITSVKPILGSDGAVTSVVCISKNITERKRVEMERERLIHELQETLSKVRTLSGLLPICAQCKKIRDDHGYWTQIEAYFRDHSGTEFSHGICPDCAHTLYPDLWNDGTNHG
jgi:PAS domain S-box-containing protein